MHTLDPGKRRVSTPPQLRIINSLLDLSLFDNPVLSMHFQNPKDEILFEVSLKLIRAMYKRVYFSRQLLPLSESFRSRQSCNQKSILRRKTLLKNDSIDISFYIFKGLTIVLCLEMFRSYNLLSNKCCLRCSTCEGQLSRSLRFSSNYPNVYKSA